MLYEVITLLLMRDANYPWFILVPDREAVTEIHHLDVITSYSIHYTKLYE